MNWWKSSKSIVLYVCLLFAWSVSIYFSLLLPVIIIIIIIGLYDNGNGNTNNINVGTCSKKCSSSNQVNKILDIALENCWNSSNKIKKKKEEEIIMAIIILLDRILYIWHTDLVLQSITSLGTLKIWWPSFAIFA